MVRSVLGVSLTVALVEMGTTGGKPEPTRLFIVAHNTSLLIDHAIDLSQCAKGRQVQLLR